MRKKEPSYDHILKNKNSAAQCFLAAVCLIAVMAIQVNAEDRDTTTKVNGVISQMQSGFIMVTTSWGSMDDPV